MTCVASSRVGVMIRAVACGFYISLAMIGMPNAPVLPVPVWAEPRISRPAIASGIACGLERGVGVENCMRASDCSVLGGKAEAG